MNVITIKRPLHRDRRPATAPVRRSMRELSRDYFTREVARHFVVETVLFVILAGISAWPIVVVLHVLNQFLQTSVA